MTVLLEFPVTADLRSAKVETRTVGPPAPPVVLCANYNVKTGAETSEYYILPKGGIANNGIVFSGGQDGQAWRII